MQFHSDARSADCTGTKHSTVTLKAFLTRLIWLCVLPLLLLAVYLAIKHVQTLRHQQTVDATVRAQNVAMAIDRQLQAHIAGLQLLAESPLLSRPPRLMEFYSQALQFRTSFGGHIILADRSTQMLLNTRRPFGSPLPLLPVVKGHGAAPQALATGKPAVGDQFLGPVARQPLVAAAAPVIRNGKTIYLLVNTMESRQLQKTLDEWALPAGCALTLFDGKGEVIASRQPPDRRHEGIHSRDTEQFPAALTIAPWQVVIQVPPSTYRTPVVAAAVGLFATIGMVTLVSLLGGRFAGQRLARSVAALARGNQLPGRFTHITEIEQARQVLQQAAQERDRAEAIRREARSTTSAPWTACWRAVR